MSAADDDWALLLADDRLAPAPRRVAAFLRVYARRIRRGEHWDNQDTMANAYESAAATLDRYMDARARLRWRWLDAWYQWWWRWFPRR